MECYLAGNQLWKPNIKEQYLAMKLRGGEVYNAGVYPSNGLKENCMEVYNAGMNGIFSIIKDSIHEKSNKRYYQENRLKNDPNRINLLQSFFYVEKDNDYMDVQNANMCNIIIDSGAFTFMQGQKDVPNWENFTDRYCDWILRQGIKNFVEMDVDWVTSVEHAKKLRERIEKRTGMQPLPCWHTCRGKEAWIDICKNYDYAALSLGGATKTTSWFKAYNYKQLPWFLDVALKYNCKVHGLGLTKMSVLKDNAHKMHSVDSTAWLAGNLGGFIYIFDPIKGEFTKVHAPEGMRAKSKEIAKHNFGEWIKFQKWARVNL